MKNEILKIKSGNKYLMLFMKKHPIIFDGSILEIRVLCSMVEKAFIICP